MFLSLNAEPILTILAGEEYEAAAPVLLLMGIYSIYYSLGQINLAFFYATDQVKLLRNFAIWNCIIGVSMTYLLVAPKYYTIPGLQMGAIGLGLKSVLLMIGISSAQIYLITKKAGLNFRHFLLKQVYIISLLCGLLVASKAGIQIWRLSPLFHLLGIFTVYVFLTVILVYAWPKIVGITVYERNEYKRQFYKKSKIFLKIFE